ncbi:MAG: hypothetical protein HYY37_04270 [Candidatus Aenigmarchaeota archaeon]|nr:hypothetical protein [Candidatus Aenigmarchaeota archaeon]
MTAAYGDPRFSRVAVRSLLGAMRDLGISRRAYLRFFSLERKEKMIYDGTDRDEKSPHRNRQLEEERNIGPADYTYVHRLPYTYPLGEMGLADGTHGVAVYGHDKMEYMGVAERYAAIFKCSPSEALLAVILPKGSG